MNKKIIIWGSGSFAALILASILFFTFAPFQTESNNKPLKPSDVITEFRKAVESGKVEDTKIYVSNEILKTFESGRAWGTYPEYIRWNREKYKSIKPISEKITGETATVKANVTYTDNSKEEKKYYLIKENDQWKIAE